MFFEVFSHFFVLQSYILHLFYSSFASNLRSPKGANLNSGRLKGYRNGRVWRIPKVAVQAYILEQAKIKK